MKLPGEVQSYFLNLKIENLVIVFFTRFLCSKNYDKFSSIWLGHFIKRRQRHFISDIVSWPLRPWDSFSTVLLHIQIEVHLVKSIILTNILIITYMTTT